MIKRKCMRLNGRLAHVLNKRKYLIDLLFVFLKY